MKEEWESVLDNLFVKGYVCVVIMEVVIVNAVEDNTVLYILFYIVL